MQPNGFRVCPSRATRCCFGKVSMKHGWCIWRGISATHGVAASSCSSCVEHIHQRSVPPCSGSHSRPCSRTGDVGHGFVRRQTRLLPTVGAIACRFRASGPAPRYPPPCSPSPCSYSSCALCAVGAISIAAAKHARIVHGVYKQRSWASPMPARFGQVVLGLLLHSRCRGPWRRRT